MITWYSTTSTSTYAGETGWPSSDPTGSASRPCSRSRLESSTADAGKVQWGHEVRTGYFAQDHRQALTGSDATVESWLVRGLLGESTGAVRSRLAQVLFSGDEVEKKLPVCRAARRRG